ncbi:hypothetical protein BCR33DRAFT_712020 [Rhizoclosmatium globosum]|uniref:Raptor N-terminal CASPase-like domain-containing protein n=1 Tax=Rhizoclosmatium globosum TaxID=329046 RepID=A0A1Y2CYA1_9FUNG|nr:hypothetical protein BCR33DRAFT_712020 [Rhizoclosmatium globosum]|eukprot:ORY51824.1 hypothetical protein BCR33DRAFT_712020 [Rhizoclosmatium globosum]
MYSFLIDRRHEACGIPASRLRPPPTSSGSGFASLGREDGDDDWRMRERLKTVSVALVLCLNIGIDPPDVLKTSPCAKLECWVDPASLPPQKALETIGKNLQQQYEVWQPRSRYKALLDPSVEETKKTCVSLRKNAKDERILFHYNGHGVPRPTKGGEIWVFNKSYTQYLPCSIYDIQQWLGSPCIYVFDCSNAGNILLAFDKFADQRDEDAAAAAATARRDSITTPDPPVVSSQQNISMKECILLAACGPSDTLPMNPDLPADLFTCCLTTPIEIALRWFVSQNPLLQNITADMIMKIPGQLNDRRTPLGELNWIFTAITDTIAWNMLPHDLFKKLFRQDLMVAALFRNFLLAERIMRYYHCTPMSSPVLPSTHQHPLWSSWDLAAEMCLYQLPDLLKSPNTVQYQHSSFFSEQLTAFEVWLSKGPIAKSHPEQLPIVLQVLLSQVHRLRALMLLSRFLDLGPWSVKLALSVGIFPYVLKLLQSPAAELKPVLVFIWAKILALDNSCQNDLLKDNGFTYFINILTSINSPTIIPNMSEHRAMCAFILSVFCHGFRFAQEACLKNDLLITLSLHLNDPDPLLRQWAAICLAKTIEQYPQARDHCLRENLHLRLLQLLQDSFSEVRAAALFALSSLVQNVAELSGGKIIDHPKYILAVENCVCEAIVHGLSDASPVVRKELVIMLSRVVSVNYDRVLEASALIAKEELGSASVTGASIQQSSDPAVQHQLRVYQCVYKSLLSLSVDPYPLISRLASHVVDKIHVSLLGQNLIQAPAALLAPVLTAATRSKNNSSSSLSAATGAAALKRQSTFATTRTNSTSSLSSLATHQSAARRFSHLEQNGAASGIYSSSVASSNGSGASGLKRNSSSFVVNPFKSFQGLASLVTFPSVNVNLAAPLVGDRNAGGESDDDAMYFGSNRGVRRGDESGNSTADSAKNGFAAYFHGGSGTLHPVEEDIGAKKMDLEKAIEVHLVKDATDEIGVELKSCFYDFNLEYFREPQMKVPDVDDPGSTPFNQKLWRHQQNEKYASNSILKSPDFASQLKFDNQVNFLHSDNNPGTHLYFHPFEPHLLGADDADGVIVYNWEDGSRINWFRNSNPPGSRITSLRFINENDVALIVTGSDEGIVRIYKNYTSLENCEVVSAWRAVNENIPVSPRADLITDWHQQTGSLLVAGDLRMIRVWDLERELCVQDIGTKYQQAVTSLTSERSEGNLLIAGYADGMLNLYDKRLPSRESLVRSFGEHSNRILQCQFQNDGRGDYHTLVSGSRTGDVRIWDIRSPKQSVRVIEAVPSGIEMTALAIHEDAPLFACGTNSEYVRIFNVNGVNLNTIRYNDGFLGPRIGHVGCLAFHPYRDILAAGTSDNASLSLFSSQR